MVREVSISKVCCRVEQTRDRVGVKRVQNFSTLQQALIVA